MIFLKIRKQLRFSVAVLIIANLVPVLGVLMWDWNVFIILILYCMETFVIGIYNVFKMLAVKQPAFGIRLFMSIFFLIHFNMFVLVQTLFVVVFSQIGEGTLVRKEVQEEVKADSDFVDDVIIMFTDKFLLETLLVLIISHGFSFIFNYLRGREYRRTDASKLMFSPYGRIIVQQLTVIFGGFGIAFFAGSVMPLLLLLVVFKTVLDMRSHIKSHGVEQPVNG